jgi:hypothetical protein
MNGVTQFVCATFVDLFMVDAFCFLHPPVLNEAPREPFNSIPIMMWNLGPAT